MRQITQNTFSQGMKMDLNPLTTPNTILTDCLNGTLITYNGNEFVLQNDQGNCKVDTARLKPGFIPLGMAEYGGIIYVVSYNPISGASEYGSFPSPQRDFSTSDFSDLAAVNFNTSEFILETNTTTEQSTKYIGKLSEPELFELHPGDLYVVTYTINDPNPSGTSSTEIDDQTKMDNYISKDVANRKLFRLKFYKITDSNNLVELDPTKMKVIPNQTDVSSEYVYFTENSNSTLAVGLEFEQLDMFDANVIDTSRKTNSDKTVVIEAIGQSASMADFEGVRVQVTKPSVQDFFLDKAVGGKKASAVISGLAASDDFECSITPYCKYALFPKLRKNFKLTIGKYLSGGSGVNDIFQYYTDNTTNTIKVDFDFKFEGDTIDGVHLYVEFYDPWSDYSVVKRVDNPTYYGANSVIVDLIDEPRVDTFNSTTVGGTPASKLIVNADTIYEKTLLNSTNMVRTDATLRRNHFYIVRISGVDKDVASGVATYRHYDLYKGLYTSDMFNSIYSAQSALSITDPGYVSDFNTLDFDISSIGYATTMSVPTITTKPIITTSTPADLMTGNDYYAIRNTVYPTTATYQNSKTYETNAEYTVQLDLQGIDKIFGTFKTSMLSFTFPNLIATDAGGTGYRPAITEQAIPNTPATGSRGEWIATALSGVLYKVNLKAFTSRSVAAPATYTPKTGTLYEEVSLLQTFHHFPNNNGPLSNPSAVIELSQSPNQVRYIDSLGVQRTKTFTEPATPDDNSLFQLYEIDAAQRRHSAFWGTMANRASFWWWAGGPGDYGGDTGETSHRKSILFLRNALGQGITACRTHSIDVAKDFFNTLKVASNITTNLYLYHPDASFITKNDQLTSTFSYTGAPIISSFSPTSNGSGGYIKTYLSNFRFRALGTIEEFNPTVINSYIASRVGSSTIMDGKIAIRDGFIPYLSTPRQTSFNLQFGDIVINQAADSSIYSSFLNAETIGAKSPAFAGIADAKPHGTLFSKEPTKYTQYINKFIVGDVFPNTQVNPLKVYIYLKDASEPRWSGYFRIGGSPKHRPAPDLFVDFQLS